MAARHDEPFLFGSLYRERCALLQRLPMSDSTPGERPAHSGPALERARLSSFRRGMQRFMRRLVELCGKRSVTQTPSNSVQKKVAR